MRLQDPVTELRGVGPKKAEALSKLHIETVEDLIRLLPRTYEDRREVTPIAQLQAGKTVTVMGRVEKLIDNYYRRGRKQMLRVLVSDDTGALDILFFNARFLKRAFQVGRMYAFYGTVTETGRGRSLVHPQFTPAEEREEGILPIYPLTRGISQRDMRAWQKQAEEVYPQIEDDLPQEVRDEGLDAGLMDPASALKSLHFPTDRETYLRAKYRMIFDELFVLQTGILAVRNRSAAGRGIAFSREPAEEEYIRSMSFPLTGAQKRVVKEIMEDLVSDRAMNRLVQGDVGSGKTAVAQIAMYKAVRNGYQAVLMAPTEILARQHYQGIREDFSRHGIEVGFLSGSMKAAERRQVLEGLQEGSIHVLVGTHAVIQPEVSFHRLGLVITDEQHRFGVDQRIRLREKGGDASEGPNVLVMTATPIPRTLAVVLYGDLDISVIDEMPPGRTPIATRSTDESHREDCYRFAQKQMEQGRQVYVVTPLIEDSESMDVRSAEAVAEELKTRFDGRHGCGFFCVELLHGNMKQAEKDRIMEDFNDGQIDLLVSTVVIEVGINVPNATVMIMENAERFGLAQMHQLRGRVGRGTSKSYCFLISQGSSEVARQRGEIMEKSTDGFFIAEEDLKLRGPGDIFGTRQHGLPALYIADLVRHAQILQEAREKAQKLVKDDPELGRPEHAALRGRVLRLFGGELSLDL